MNGDRVALLSLVALVTAYGVAFVNFSAPPFEDGAILLRYATHVAQGHGLVWNIGEAPVDGATDIPFTLIVGAIAMLGVRVEQAARGLSILAHVVTVVVVYRVLRRIQGAGVTLAFLCAAYVALGPGLLLAAAGFGTTLFVLATVLAWAAAQRLIASGRRRPGQFIAFSALALFMGLVRPEGVLMAGFMALAVLLCLPAPDRWRCAALFIAVFLVAGGAYFAWRWWYFGYPLPNPYYRKGGGTLHLDGLRNSIKNTLALTYPFLWAFPLALRDRATARLAAAFAIPIVGSTLMWALLSDEMNHWARFQYPILAIVALSWYPLVHSLLEDAGVRGTVGGFDRRTRQALALSGISIAALVFALEVWRRPDVRTADGRYDVGVALSRFAHRGYSLATTEAGLLPLYSRWRTLDAWGLNDQWIAHNGGVTEDYIDTYRPAVCMIHRAARSSAPANSWERTATTLEDYAITRGYRLAGAYGIPPYDAHYYYVRPGLPDSDALVAAIQAVRYRW